jgi:hypothetical protein
VFDKQEAKGNFNEATRLYDELLEENPANLLVLKRKVSILKAQGRTSAAISELNNLIKTFQCDESSVRAFFLRTHAASVQW